MTDKGLYLLKGELLDILATADAPMPTSLLAIRLTSAASRLVRNGVAERSDVLSVSIRGDEEVNGTTAARLAEAEPLVVMTGKSSGGWAGRRGERLWALKSKAIQWAEASEAKLLRRVAAQDRYQIVRSGGRIRVLDLNGTTSPVAQFDLGAIDEDVAQRQAEAVVRHLVRKEVAGVTGFDPATL